MTNRLFEDKQARPDFLIVGGGTAGAVMAARLSESGQHRVLLIEAGIDTPPDQTPADIDDTFPSSTLNPAYFWSGLEATVVKGGRPRPFPQARVMGGGSSIMGMFALRGVPSGCIARSSGTRRAPPPRTARRPSSAWPRTNGPCS
jgi:choline dehydrogenase-like flavoprotein